MSIGKALLTASLALGCIIGCLTAGAVSEKYGRKPGLMIAAAIFLISSLAMAFAPGRDSFLTAQTYRRNWSGNGIHAIPLKKGRNSSNKNPRKDGSH